MDMRLSRRVLVPLALGTAAVWALLACLGAARAGIPDTRVAHPSGAIQRPQDPVVIPGSNFPALDGAPLTELVLYAYHSGMWEPIPSQIDEIDITGTYVISDGGFLDANDELVFMARDLGQGAPPEAVPNDEQAQLNPSFAISVTDALSPTGGGWVYLFRSSTLTRTATSYLSWDQAAQTMTAISYTASFTSGFLGLADLDLNGRGVDVMDRQKIRVQAFGGLITFNEETLAALITPTITLPVAGPIRAVTGAGALRAAFYGSRFDFDVTFDTSDLPVNPDLIRTSLDLNDPLATGLDRYYDSNTPAGAIIDGVPDPISTTPPMDWYQVSGAAAGPGGLVVIFPQVDPAGGSLFNYYLDDAGPNPADTGDGRSYADTGLLIETPGDLVQLSLVAYVLPVSTTTNLGELYSAWVNDPLAFNVEVRGEPSPSPLYLPVLLR